MLPVIKGRVSPFSFWFSAEMDLILDRHDNNISMKRRHKKALAESLTEMKRKSIKDAKTEDRRVDAIR